MDVQFIALVGLGLLLGARHAIDWDHVAAITDFIGGEEKKKRAFLLSLTYILGHESVNLILGIVAVLIGQTLPDWLDGIMERMVGITLIILGAWLIVVLIQNWNKKVMVSRWKMLFTGLRKLYSYISSKILHKHHHNHDVTEDMGTKEAYFIGVIAGFGAETATQILLFATAAGAGTVFLGITAVFAFILGLFAGQLIMILVLLAGYSSIARNKKVYNSIAVVTSVYSLVLGIMFILGQGSLLPDISLIFGGLK